MTFPDHGLINYIQDSVCNEGREHIVFHMRTSPEECKRRLKNRFPGRIEEKGVEFHRMVFDRYLTLLRTDELLNQFCESNDIYYANLDVFSPDGMEGLMSVMKNGPRR
ncbi:hypothetical protein [Actinopolymorpha alba]|uniref:hypothetical protein n=1 Tax=Actinopolymorpha alba TaxID=533267 RepID=UPI000476F0EB|nr:hypothetical protein [Actinopolymorpha alba]